MSAAIPQRGLDSSTTTRRPVFSTLRSTASSSNGEVVRGSINSTETPSSLAMAFWAKPTIWPSATTVTSSPD